MFELKEEELLMSSPDNVVRLTTHRIIFESKTGRQQVMLEDFDSYELKNESLNTYAYIFWLLSLLAFILIIKGIEYYFNWGDEDGYYIQEMLQYILLIMVLLIPAGIFYKASRRYMVYINGKYNSIAFKVESFHQKGLEKMLKRLVEQSENIKADIKHNVPGERKNKIGA